jgi:hypothetical protein
MIDGKFDVAEEAIIFRSSQHAGIADNKGSLLCRGCFDGGDE